MKTLYATICAVVMGLAGGAPAWASDTFPERPLRMLVGFAPGGATDISGRIIAKRMAEELGQAVVVENRAGAGGNVATEAVSRADPDGYTFMLTSIGPLVVAPHMGIPMRYDPKTDLQYLSMAVSFPEVLVVHPSLGASSLEQFIAQAKKPDSKLTYGSSGVGSAGNLAGELFKQMAGVQLPHIAYRGGGPAMNDLMGGNVPAVFATLPSALQQIKAGKIVALATTGQVRAKSLTDVPTMAELGLKGYESVDWYGFVAPAATPDRVVNRLNQAIVAALNDEEVVRQLEQNAMVPNPTTPAEMRAYVQEEDEKWGGLIEKTGIGRVQ